MNGPVLVYTIRIDATPEEVWRGLTEPDLTRRYWFGMAFESDWRVGSPVLWQYEPGGAAEDIGQVVLESEPHRRLAYTWHRFQRSHAMLFGWSDEELARRARERPSKVAFDIVPEDDGRAVRLTITHDDFEPDSLMYQAISGQLEGSGGWPGLMTGMKTLLETGRTAPVAP
ncbi:SRPBCC family protein [Saccharothrix sp. NRRL B-16314]|uniref:SRPBCC family protein n=1 Tax=Saccharothrix sp. NRRL B-16314 TaxID=1463825 RepID=UPI001E3ECD22|nr:SRPBCC family protein [Saccharothrix sp. NRRL B-16314]